MISLSFVLFGKVNRWSIDAAERVKEMQVGSEMVQSDICTMLDQLHQLELCIADDGPQAPSLIDHVNVALSKLPPDSQLHTYWRETQSLYEETMALIKHCQSDLVEAQSQFGVDEKDSVGRIEAPPCHTNDHISDRSATQQQLCSSPPVCYVKPTPVVLNVSTSSSAMTPFDLRNYLIDKNAPITEPVFKSTPITESVFKPALTSQAQGSIVKLVEMSHRRSSDGAAAGTCVKGASPCAAVVSSATHSSWQLLKKKAVGLLTDGLGARRSAMSQLERHKSSTGLVTNEGFQRSDCKCYSIYCQSFALSWFFIS